MKRAVWSSVGMCVLFLCCLGALLVAPAARAEALPSSTPDAGVSFTDGAVDAIATAPNGITYIGGDFTHVRSDTGGGAALAATSDASDVRFPHVDGYLLATVSDGSGGFYIGGHFTNVGGIARNNIAHIWANGAVDLAFDPNANGDVETLAVSGSTIYVGGYFTTIGGQPRNYLAAVNATSGAATAWNPNVSDSAEPQYCAVWALAVSGSTIYVGGYFTAIGGQARNYIAAVDATSGALTAWDPDANSSVSALAVSGSTVFAGGYFWVIGGQYRDNIAALDATTGAATAWNLDYGSDGTVPWALTVSGSTLYIGADGYMQIGSQSRAFAAAVDVTSGVATAWNPNANGEVWALSVSGSTVYVGGSFTYIGGQARSHIAALDATSGAATAWDPDANGTVYALAVAGATIYAGGDFTFIGSVARNHIAALDPSGALTAWDPNADITVRALAVSGSTVYAGGEFMSIGGQRRIFIAALDASSGLATASDPSAAGSSVDALSVSGSTAYVGGYFPTIGGQKRDNVAALDATSGAATAWDPNANNTVRALAVSGSTVYVGGEFTSIGGQSRHYIAALDATSGLATAWNPNAGGSYPYVCALAVSGSTVYVGGEFTSIGGQSRLGIAALDATSGLATAWNPNAAGTNLYVTALAVSGSTVYVGGELTSIGGQPRNHIAALDATSGVATSWNPNADGLVNALAVSRWSVYAGGDFHSIGGQARQGLARFSLLPPTAPTPTSPNGGENWRLGCGHDITWDVGNGGAVSIELSRDSGASWQMLFAATPNDGSQSWTVSGPITSQALVRIANANGSNCSAASFAIAAALTGSMSLNGGAAYTPSAAVTINSSVAGVSEMRFRYVGDSWSGWQPYAAGAAWTLPAGDGTQTVEAQYRDANANVLPLSDSIVEDMTPPETTDNSDAQTFGSFRLVLTPSDDTSGVAATEYRIDGGPWQTGRSVLLSIHGLRHRRPAFRAGSHTIQYYSTDAAGNAESVKSCTVTL